MFDVEQILTGAQRSLQAADFLDVLRALVSAFVFAQILAWTYEASYRGLSYSRGFGHALVLICIAAAILVQTMAHSLIAGIGLFGVLSMIRFRATLKAPRDLVFVLGAATIGTACGVGSNLVAGLGTAVFSVVALYLHSSPFGSKQRFDGVLRFRIDSNSSEVSSRLEALLERYCRRHLLLSVTEVAQGSRIEHTYQVKFWRDARQDELLRALKAEFQAADARLLLQEATLEY